MQTTRTGWLYLCLSLCQSALLFAIVLASQSATAATEFALSEVAPGVFVHEGRHEEMTLENQGDIGNSGFVVGSESVAVIDPGGSLEVGRLLLAAIREQTELPIRYVILTHIHPDHWAGVGAFPKESQIVTHNNFPRALAQRGEFYRQRFSELLGTQDLQSLMKPDILIEDLLNINLGGRELRIRAYPTAHTDNDLTVLDKDTDTLFASDLVFSVRTPSLDGSLPGWLSVLKELASEDPQLVIPGHGRPSDWPSATAEQIQYLQTLESETRRQIKQGKSLSLALKTAEKDEGSANFELYNQVHPTNITKAYTELEWE